MCEIGYDDDSGASTPVYRTTERRAAKPHRCQACCAVILPGERYCYGSGVSEGSGFSERACLLCAKVRKDFAEAHDFCPAFQELGSALHECIAEGDPESLAWKPMLAGIRERQQTAQVQLMATKAIVGLLEPR